MWVPERLKPLVEIDTAQDIAAKAADCSAPHQFNVYARLGSGAAPTQPLGEADPTQD
jgi:hypothetical protein